LLSGDGDELAVGRPVLQPAEHLGTEFHPWYPLADVDHRAGQVADGYVRGPVKRGQRTRRIFISTALEKTVDRAVLRERRVSTRADVQRRWRERYIPSRQLYFATVRPTHQANFIVHNGEPQLPVWETKPH
jgi:hypothetical protein